MSVIFLYQIGESANSDPDLEENPNPVESDQNGLCWSLLECA